jgi:predicted nucleotidyltransferase
MDAIDPSLTREERLARGNAIAGEWFDTYPQIESIYVFGSTVRGDDLPTSDLDMHYLIASDAERPPLKKEPRDGVMIDVEAYSREDLTVEAVLDDAYIFGLIRDAVILHDRTGYTTRVQQEALASDTPERTRKRAAGLIEPVRRNCAGFGRAVETHDYGQLCKTAAFTIWCLADYLLAKRSQAVGGFRTFPRVKAVDPEAYRRLIHLQDSSHRSAAALRSFSDLASGMWNQSKCDWLFRNGYKDEAFHMLWICLGLELKALDKDPDADCVEELTRRARGWLDRLGWSTRTALRAKAHEMAQLVALYVP